MKGLVLALRFGLEIGLLGRSERRGSRSACLRRGLSSRRGARSWPRRSAFGVGHLVAMVGLGLRGR